LVNYYKEYMKLVEDSENIEEFIESSIITKADKLPDLLRTQRQLTVLNTEKTKALLAEKTLKLEVYAPEMTHKIREYYFVYRSKLKTKKDIYFNSDGMVIEEDDISVSEHELVMKKKNVKAAVPIGYNLSRGLLIYGEYRLTIDATETRVIKTLIGFYVTNAFNSRESFKLDTSGKVDKKYTSFNDFNNWLLPRFYNEFYGVQSIPTNMEPSKLFTAKTECVNFELVIKTAPQWMVNFMFESNAFRGLPKAKHLSELFKVNKKVYKEYRDEPNNLIYVSWLINKQQLTEGKAITIMTTFNDLYQELLMYTKNMGNNGNSLPKEITNLVVTNTSSYRNSWMRGWEEDKASLFQSIIVRYFTNKIVKKYYTMDKYLAYARNAIINQGFMSVSAFVDQLYDYHEANDRDEYEPVVEPDYLRRVHDVYVANRTIVVTQEMEDKFIHRYKDDEDWMRALEEGETEEDRVFFITNPKKSRDLKREGNILSHCVGGYIPTVCEGKTKIYFLRKLMYPNEPFVTVEIKDGALSQASGLTNRAINGNLKALLLMWCKEKGYKYNL